MLSADNDLFSQELNRQLEERPIIEEQFREWVEEVHKMGTEFPLMFPDRDDVIMPQWAVKVGMHTSPQFSPSSSLCIQMCGTLQHFRYSLSITDIVCRSCMRRPREMPSSRQAWASTRCGLRSTTNLTDHGSGQLLAAWAVWALDCPQRWVQP